MVNRLYRLFLQVFLSVVIALALTFYFVDISPTYDFNRELNCYLPSSNQKIHHISEGNGVTVLGRYGIVSGDFNSNLNSINIWGDSYVEAFHVDDEFKISSILQGILNNKVNVASIGCSGRSVADYCYLMPYYSKIIKNVICNVIIVGSIDDFLPNQTSSEWIVFKYTTDKGFFFDNYGRKLKYQNVKKVANKIGLHPLWSALKRTKDNINFEALPLPSIVGGNSVESSPREKYKLNDAFTFLIQKLKEASSTKLMIVYLPHVPRIVGNKIVYCDEDEQDVRLLATLCANEGVEFVNMKDAFIEGFHKSKRFPRGFVNSRIGDGHMNSWGHKVVAEEISHYMLQD